MQRIAETDYLDIIEISRFQIFSFFTDPLYVLNVQQSCFSFSFSKHALIDI